MALAHADTDTAEGAGKPRACVVGVWVRGQNGAASVAQGVVALSTPGTRRRSRGVRGGGEIKCAVGSFTVRFWPVMDGRNRTKNCRSGPDSQIIDRLSTAGCRRCRLGFVDQVYHYKERTEIESIGRHACWYGAAAAGDSFHMSGCYTDERATCWVGCRTKRAWLLHGEPDCGEVSACCETGTHGRLSLSVGTTTLHSSK
jgi:hypothetical protein